MVKNTPVLRIVISSNKSWFPGNCEFTDVDPLIGSVKPRPSCLTPSSLNDS